VGMAHFLIQRDLGGVGGDPAPGRVYINGPQYLQGVQPCALALGGVGPAPEGVIRCQAQGRGKTASGRGAFQARIRRLL